MQDVLTQIQSKLEAKHHVFMVYKNQVNKDLERSGFESIDQNNPNDFILELVSLISTAIDDSNPKLQQLYYLADVQERNLDKGIVLAFIHREWIKIQFRLRQ